MLRLEKTARKSWLEHLPDLRLKEISRKHINGFIANRQEKGLVARSVNLYVIALRNLLKRAKDEGLIKVLPTDTLAHTFTQLLSTKSRQGQFHGAACLCALTLDSAPNSGRPPNCCQ